VKLSVTEGSFPLITSAGQSAVATWRLPSRFSTTLYVKGAGPRAAAANPWSSGAVPVEGAVRLAALPRTSCLEGRRCAVGGGGGALRGGRCRGSWPDLMPRARRRSCRAVHRGRPGGQPRLRHREWPVGWRGPPKYGDEVAAAAPEQCHVVNAGMACVARDEGSLDGPMKRNGLHPAAPLARRLESRMEGPSVERKVDEYVVRAAHTWWV
jgi:hypothetical protein